ncbi:Complex 1 LYR protein [Penicillium expansum]|uniref:Complex 1 LYR protein n=1 Tax=Penicillium expansum TaxID=27334 RepID=A0A0A2I6D4_PENEN|nr:Complex 1 LYR protein [Penicillium expansum]KGO37941.1 Complex 1 LYR protein [Penicillium expansum]KGO47921.1 Complex 1 LYR protein [Penicillium expansum]KGO49708.1 Complex 1 LYR protein [Penicillium expansum]
MHKVLVPKYNGAHRFACLALYRALLRQCRPSTTTDTPWLGETKPLVQQNFQKYKKLQSPSQTANALKAGYEALDLLSSAHTNRRDSQRITTLIAQAKSQKDKYAAMQRKIRPVAPPAKPLTAKKARKEKSIRFQEETNQRHPNATSILNRPQPLGDKKRNVPVLVNARGIPFLRYKKPQPRNVSSVIRTKLGRRWNWIERRDRLKIELLFAKDEEEWDHITNTKEPSTWSEHPKNAIADVNAKIGHFDMHAKELADNMWKIVLAERALAEEEASQKQPKQPKQ